MHSDTKFSIDPGKLSPAAHEVWAALTENQQRNVQEDNPFKTIRNLEIVQLRQKGVEGAVVAEITGLSTSTISRIMQDFRAKWGKQNPGWLLKPDSLGVLNEMAVAITSLKQDVEELKLMIRNTLDGDIKGNHDKGEDHADG